ncbi:hypothetical protein E5D57_013198 [Metarhizium anisopliae]|nr:hypothetical protein E5D57_013198 [Metarhizium anisopliae]
MYRAWTRPYSSRADFVIVSSISSLHFLGQPELLQPLPRGVKSVAIVGSISIFTLQIWVEKEQLKVVAPALMTVESNATTQCADGREG